MAGLLHGVAIGLVYVPVETTTIREAKLEVALEAAYCGYTIAEVFAVGPGWLPVDAILARAERLAVDEDAEAVFVRGPVDRRRVEELAARARLVVRRVGRAGYAFSGRADSQTRSKLAT